MKNTIFPWVISKTDANDVRKFKGKLIFLK